MEHQFFGEKKRDLVNSGNVLYLKIAFENSMRLWFVTTLDGMMYNCTPYLQYGFGDLSFPPPSPSASNLRLLLSCPCEVALCFRRALLKIEAFLELI